MQVLVVGAGVIGLAVARAAALAGHDVIVAEAAGAIGTGTSSRNSEVIHAGIYYPTDSLRARHCTRGRRTLYGYCDTHGVPHRKLGKLLIVTRQEDVPLLETLYAQALTNGVENLAMLEAAEAKRMEPELSCVAAFHSPETGIIDSHRYMLALRGDLEDRGGMIAFHTPVDRIASAGGGFEVQYGGAEPGTIRVDAVVNAAGHGAQRLAAATEPYPRDRVPRLVLAKGNYFSYVGRPAFSRLIYPAPVPGGLGIHVTLDLAGRMRFGPDVEWIDEPDYAVDPARAASFYRYVRRYWPRLPDNALVPDYAGIRPKLTGPGEPAADFMVDTPRAHGVPRLVQLFGIESPGLTSSLSLADDVVAALEE
ncbi:MAG TPA: NAD(P)/FAD-dependent oxidoreductase [Xanthobacteraceae bacterium]|nr:NAD(P)/FAD-dependent oxidoreductase [Xanthobacteraceae bacterium]